MSMDVKVTKRLPYLVTRAEKVFVSNVLPILFRCKCCLFVRDVSAMIYHGVAFDLEVVE